MNSDAALARLVHFYETLTPGTLGRELARVYAPEASFKDPFNEVQGLGAISGIFEHMFTRVAAPRFVVHVKMRQDMDAFLTWSMLFETDDGPMCIRGASHVQFNAQGLVLMHRDYWDAAEELYEKVPLVGGLMRFLKRRVMRPA